MNAIFLGIVLIAFAIAAWRQPFLPPAVSAVRVISTALAAGKRLRQHRDVARMYRKVCQMKKCAACNCVSRAREVLLRALERMK